MNELFIKPNGSFLRKIPINVSLIFVFFTFSNYLSSGPSEKTQLLIALTLFFSLWALWYSYVSSKRLISINRTTKEIQTREFSFFGVEKRKTYQINNFSAVQSYISRGKGSRNIVELITLDGNRGLKLDYFFPCGGKKFWSFEVESENPKAALLASEVAEFTSLRNKGYIGHKFVTTQIDVGHDANFIRNMF